MRVAVVGAGISGLAAAYTLAKAGAEVVVYEEEGYLGGHAKTVSFDGILVDLGFTVFNRVSKAQKISKAVLVGRRKCLLFCKRMKFYRIF